MFSVHVTLNLEINVAVPLHVGLLDVDRFAVELGGEALAAPVVHSLKLGFPVWIPLEFQLNVVCQSLFEIFLILSFPHFFPESVFLVVY